MGANSFAAAPVVTTITVNPTTTAHEQVLDFDVQADPDRPFNSGAAPLANTVFNAALRANQNATVNQSRVMPLMLTEERIGFASQGSDTTHAMTFGNWQYVDRIVSWGGTSERNVTAPGQAWIDAAHRNGVKIYGNIFLAPNVFGGDLNQIDYLLQKGRRGSFVVADRLIELAETQNFDGWFLNQETHGANSALAEEIGTLVDYIQSTSDIEVIWYDSMQESGSIGWQGQLNSTNDRFFQHNGQTVSDAMFLDFRNSVGNSNANATALGRSPYDLYKGANLEGGGIADADFNMDAALSGGQQTSVGLFRPENYVWNEFNGNWNIQNMINAEDRLYVGANGNPSNTANDVPGTTWNGFAHHIAAKSPLTRDRFVSNFSYGIGENYSIDGEQVSPDPWNNMGAQDVLPTWRWRFESAETHTLAAEFDFTEAYVGGNSLRVSGSLTASTDMPLYLAAMPVHDDSKLTFTYKTVQVGVPNLQAYITLAGAEQDRIAIDLGSSGAGWNQAELDLSAYQGETISSVGLRFLRTRSNNFDVNVGQIGLLRGDRDVLAPASNISLQETPIRLTPSKYELRLLWDHSTEYSNDPTANNLYYYNVFQEFAGGNRELLGVTGGEGYWINDLTRVSGSEYASLIVQAVSLEFGTSETEFLLDWSTLTQLEFDPADYNQDHLVDAADYTLWRDTLGSTTDLRANGDNTGASQNVIDEADYAFWMARFNSSTLAALDTANVPEPPAAAVLFSLLALMKGFATPSRESNQLGRTARTTRSRPT